MFISPMEGSFLRGCSLGEKRCSYFGSDNLCEFNREGGSHFAVGSLALRCCSHCFKTLPPSVLASISALLSS